MCPGSLCFDHAPIGESSSMREGDAPRTVQCYHCRRFFDVPARAMSIGCPWCYKRVGLDDLTIKGVCWTSKIQTCGRVVVRPRSTLVAPLIEASQGIDVHGSCEGTLVTGGRIYVGPKARVRGSLRAPSIVVEKGGVIDGAMVRIAVARPEADATTGVPRLPRGADPELRPVIRVPEWVKGLRMG